MNEYCPYCVSNKTSNGYACGYQEGMSLSDRPRKCLTGEIQILRSEKEQATVQNYDLSWHLQQFGHATSALRTGGELHATLDALNTDRGVPFPQRNDPLTHEHNERIAALRERHKGDAN